jgi:3-hydroxybutyryl-CoA dehydratase
VSDSVSNPAATPDLAPPEVAPVTRQIDQPRVDRYAVAARDPNPIHRDTPEAAASQFGRPVAHGMLVLALVSEIMTNAYGMRWAESGTLKIRWRAPALPPLEVTASAVLRKAVGGVATYDVTCADAGGELLLTGTASARYA